MIDFAPILKIIPIFIIALAAPGPDFMMISSMALSRGRLAGILAAAGIAAGVLVYTVLSMFGMDIVFSRMSWLISAIRIGGALYLIYLGIQLWRASLKASSAQEASEAASAKSRNPFLVGFLTNMTNPKAVAFFTSIFALTLPHDASWATKGAIVVVIGIMPVLWFGIVAVGLSSPPMKRLYLRWSRWIDRVAGTLLAFFGVRLLFSGKN
ncbi:MAG: LysE family transporter [Alphaproteobacteria bacterium]|nr:LysE family transporter [Alphaproteobacteria bacterium]